MKIAYVELNEFSLATCTFLDLTSLINVIFFKVQIIGAKTAGRIIQNFFGG